MDIIACFNENKRDSYWTKKTKGVSNEEKCKSLFRRKLKHLLLEIELTDNNVHTTTDGSDTMVSAPVLAV